MKKLKLYNARMLELMEGSGMTAKEFFESIGFNYTNISQLRAGKQSFTLEQMDAAIKKYSLDANYFFKKDALQRQMKRELTVKELLKEAIRKL
jgi:transcriptional regulator with XRE-family HTH domain